MKGLLKAMGIFVRRNQVVMSKPTVKAANNTNASRSVGYRRISFHVRREMALGIEGTLEKNPVNRSQGSVPRIIMLEKIASFGIPLGWRSKKGTVNAATAHKLRNAMRLA